MADPTESRNDEIDLSICIVTWNAKVLLVECLESIYNNCESIKVEVIVVDNASKDGSIEAVCERFPKTVIIQNTHNLGFVKPTNQALKLSRGRYVLWLNNDTLILDQALTKMVRFMDSRRDIGVCGPKVLNRDHSMQNQCRRGLPTPWACFSYFSGLSKMYPKSSVMARYLMTYFDENEFHEVDAVSGACLMVRREALEQIGFLDTDIIAYGEDLDYCFRATKAGWMVCYYPSAQIIHYGGQGGSGVRPFASIYYFYSGVWVVYRKHIASGQIFLVNWVMAVAIWTKFAISIIINSFRRKKVIGSRKP